MLTQCWQVFEWVKNHGGEPIIPFSGVFENRLVDMPEDERDKYCKEVSHTYFFRNLRCCITLCCRVHFSCIAELSVHIGANMASVGNHCLHAIKAMLWYAIDGV